MYSLTDDEFEKYSNNYLFRASLEAGFRLGLSKEEVLSKLVVELLNEKEIEFKAKVDAAMNSSSPALGIK